MDLDAIGFIGFAGKITRNSLSILDEKSNESYCCVS